MTHLPGSSSGEAFSDRLGLGTVKNNRQPAECRIQTTEDD